MKPRTWTYCWEADSPSSHDSRAPSLPPLRATQRGKEGHGEGSAGAAACAEETDRGGVVGSDMNNG